MASPFDSNLNIPDHLLNPPLKTGSVRSILFALIIHGLLVAALTWGVHWRQNNETSSIQAELWSAQSLESAPNMPPVNSVVEEVQATPPLDKIDEEKPEPVQKVEEKKPEPQKTVANNDALKDAQIALEKEKKEKEKKEKEKKEKKELEKAKKLKEKKEQEKAKAEQLKKEKAEKEKLEKEKLEKAKAQKEKLAKEQAEKLAREKQRQEQINHLKNLAKTVTESSNNTTGLAKNTAAVAGTSNTGTGTAAQNSGPSAGYEGRVRARLKPNIVFTENISGNPSTEIEVRLAPDGLVVGKPKILRSSGVKSWDEAAVRAIEKTEIFPRDIDGKVPPVIILTLKPRE